MKSILRAQLFSRGYFVGRASSPDNIMDLIRALKPKVSSRKLIRIGPAGDGGYLVPDDLEGIVASISPGVSDECGFDTQIADRGIVVHLADASVSAPPINHRNFRFRPVFIETYESSSTTTLEEMVLSAAPEGDLLLQMDVEGAEYRVLNSGSSKLLARFRIMVIEFHDLSALFTPFGLREIGPVFRKILLTHEVVHIHPNNYQPPNSAGSLIVPQVMEFTFYRKDAGMFEERTVTFPHPLDAPNFPDRPDLVLPPCWRQ